MLDTILVFEMEIEAAASYDEWCAMTLKKLREASPSSLKVTLRSGVRARLVDKDFAPKWDPPSLEEVTKEMVDFFVSPLISEPELGLPIASREPSV
ncbi:hypothetical protein NL676_016147 [Syzygium grande]|nr:hypothetical protein NL676_016147 [Syzygium grande]